MDIVLMLHKDGVRKGKQRPVAVVKVGTRELQQVKSTNI